MMTSESKATPSHTMQAVPLARSEQMTPWSVHLCTLMQQDTKAAALNPLHHHPLQIQSPASWEHTPER